MEPMAQHGNGDGADDGAAHAAAHAQAQHELPVLAALRQRHERHEAQSRSAHQQIPRPVAIEKRAHLHPRNSVRNTSTAEIQPTSRML